MNAIQTYIKIAEQFSICLQLKSIEGRSEDADAVLASKSERFKIRNELDAATAATVDALERAGVDATNVQRTTDAAWHYAGRFQDEWFACKAILKQATKTTKPPKPSRVKPDSEITKWVRKNWHKYRPNQGKSARQRESWLRSMCCFFQKIHVCF